MKKFSIRDYEFKLSTYKFGGVDISANALHHMHHKIQHVIDDGVRVPGVADPEELDNFIAFIKNTPYAFYLACTYTRIKSRMQPVCRSAKLRWQRGNAETRRNGEAMHSVQTTSEHHSGRCMAGISPIAGE